jgi:hypothetical protein
MKCPFKLEKTKKCNFYSDAFGEGIDPVCFYRDEDDSYCNNGIAANHILSLLINSSPDEFIYKWIKRELKKGN